MEKNNKKWSPTSFSRQKSMKKIKIKNRNKEWSKK
jgi:hypothetical protein